MNVSEWREEWYGAFFAFRCMETFERYNIGAMGYFFFFFLQCLALVYMASATLIT